VTAARILPASLALLALAACPAAAPAASLVPPGNSAANQYTETFPTSGGNAEAKGKGKATAGDVLGAGNAKKLDSQGKQGREAAAVVAATAPPPALTPEDGGESGNESSTGGGAGQGSNGGNGGQTGAANGGASAGSGSGAAVSADGGGSSGFSEVLGQATGSTSSGGTGLLLPLVILASVIWALAFFLRRKRRTA
jgi:hypothetical protein